jgi:hypothetical protein
MKVIRLIALSVIILSGCTKNNNSNNNGGCNKPATPTISSNSPVSAGDAIKLSTPTVANAAYTWTGPGFSSHEQNPVIPNATPSMSGNYSVSITVGNCMSDAATTSVEVSNTPPCNLSANTVSYSGTKVAPGNFTMLPYCLTQGSYQMTGSDTGANIGLVVYFGSMPTKDGIYSITDMTTPTSTQVYITAENVLKRNYHSKAGGVAFVKVNGGSVSITFCSITFDDPAYLNDQMTISANITCQ